MRNWLIIAVVLLVIGLSGIGVIFAKDGSFSLNTVAIEQHQEVDGSEAKKVILTTGSMNVIVSRGMDKTIKASLVGTASKKYEEQTHLKLVRTGDTVTVSIDRKGGFTLGFNIFDVDLNLELPEQQYDSLTIKAGSGNVKLTQLSAGKLVLDNGSGNVGVADVHTDNAAIYTGSGNLKIDQLQAQKLSVKTGSGNITLSDVNADLTAHAGSGNIRAELGAIRYPMDLSTGSGNVTLNTDAKPESVLIQFSTGSGDFKNKWDETRKGGKHQGSAIFGEGRIRVKVDTGSGNFNLGKR